MGLVRHRNLLPWTLAAIYAVSALVWFGVKFSEGETFASIFLTTDQRGQRALDRGDYAAAANLFEGPLRKGSALYLQGEFGSAIAQFQSLDPQDETSLFLLANAHAHHRRYAQALANFDRLLERNPDHPARQNRDRVDQIMVDIKNQSTTGELTENVGEGDDTEVELEPLPEDIDPELLLKSFETGDAWLRQAEPDPADFLRKKFSLQMEKNNAEGSAK